MQHFRSELKSLQTNGIEEPNSFSTLRRKAFSRFTELGFPTKKWEDWQFTDFSPFEKSHFRLTTAKDLTPALENPIEPLNGYYSIVILNGHFQEDQSYIPVGVTIRTLLDVFMKNDMDDFSNSEENPFKALNISLMNCGLSIDIADGVQISKPIHFQFITTGIVDQIMNHPRLLIRLGENSSANFIEHYHCVNTTNYWNNCVTISELGKNSVFNHTRIQEDTGYHVSNIEYHLHKDSVVNSTIYNQGAELNRGDIRVSFNGKNATANINGLSLLKRNQHMDTRIIIDHMQPHCNSHQFFKYILDDKASGVFNGRVIVRKDSQKTNSSQSNKNLLLSQNARMQSNPQLEILADDVRCTHGSSTGQLSEDALYYLRTRGIETTDAQRLMVEGFSSEILAKIKDDSTADYLTNKVNSWLESLENG
jgi:Fe-S cluster assembly protein SufD